MVSSKAACGAPRESIVRSTCLLGTLGFGFSAWAVFLAGLAAIHSALSSQKASAEFDGFAFAWFLATAFLMLWVVIILCWLKGIMASSSRVLTPIIAVLISWFGFQIDEILHLTLVAFKGNTLESRFLVWSVGSIACAICLAAMLLIVASWKQPVNEASNMKAFRRQRGHHHSFRHGGGTTGGFSGHQGRSSSNPKVLPFQNITNIQPFGDPFGNEADRELESSGIANNAPQSGQEVTLSLNHKGPQ